jgi:uncharacterized membrane protein/predicted DsbA family dithiol-disulfide isomerase
MFLAIVACSALLVDSFGVTPAYCSAGSGCQAVKLAARRALGPIPVPAIGLFAWVGLLAVVTSPRGRWIRRLELAAAAIAPSVGLALIAVQAFLLKTYCPYCMVVDVAAVIGGVALLASSRRQAATSEPLQPLGVWALAALSALVPVLWPHFRPPRETPPALLGFQRAGTVTIVEFVDLSCGHCRALYPTLERLRREAGSRVNFVRLHVPLRSHRAARDGARLIACIADATVAEKLTQVLFESPSLDHASVVAAAEYVGLSEEELQTCWNDPATDALVEQNVQLLETLGFAGLPTTYVGGERIVGALPLPVFQLTLERASRSKGSATFETVAFCGIILVMTLGVILLARRKEALSA